MRVGAVDVGGTSIRAAVVDVTADGPVNIEVRRSVAVPSDPDASVALVVRLAATVQGDSVEGVGVVVPGVVDEARGVGVWSENIGWRDVPFAELLRRKLSSPVVVGHDVRAWGLAETRFGAARGYRDVAVVPVGTGIAAALVVDGRPLLARGFAGEIGHIRVAGEEPCTCGGTGCLEAVASATAIARSYARARGQPVAGSREVVDALLAGDPLAARVWRDAVKHLADGLSVLVCVCAPEAIIVGGGLAGAGDVLFDPLRVALKRKVLYSPVPEVLPACYHGTGGLAGAAVLAADYAMGHTSGTTTPIG